jgi:simple sugar transport system substrate-binding protein
VLRRQDKGKEAMAQRVKRLRSRRGLAVVTLAVTASAVAAAAGLMTSSSRASTANTSASNPTVYMIGSVANNTFWAAVKRGFEDGGRTFGLRAKYNAPGVHSSAGSIPLIQAAIGAKPAGIAINYTDKSIQKVTLQALKARIGVVLFNNNRFEPVGGKANTATTDPRITKLAYVGEDSLANAKKLATEFLPFIKKKGTVLIVDPVPGVQVLALRRQGIESVVKAKGFKTAYLPATLDQGQNLTTIGAYLQAHKEVVAVVGLGDPTANPAASYIEKNKLSIPVAAFDVDAEAIQHIKRGSLKAATDQQPYLQGYLSAANLAFMIKDHLFPLTVNTGSYIVTKQNIGEVEKAVAAGKG